jgi:predicted membrane-bound dolichyl-phosphate-mannose-protein mannosyltransferase
VSIPFFETKFYGAMATLDVSETLNVKEGQISAEIWLTNYQKDHFDNFNLVQAGWNVSQFVLTPE